VKEFSPDACGQLFLREYIMEKNIFKYRGANSEYGICSYRSHGGMPLAIHSTGYKVSMTIPGRADSIKGLAAAK
jgi:hypothetical protein